MFGKLKRLASHAGSWYSKDQKILDQQLDTYLSEAQNELSKLSLTNTGKIRAIIGPHAGLTYSGKVSAFAYCQINPKNYKRIILLGPSHYVFLESCALTLCHAYQTPLGDINIDQDISKELLKEGNFRQMSVEIDEQEHSLELHLPFIKKVFKDNKDIKLVPIMVGNLSRQQEQYYGKLLAKYLKDEDNLFIVSSDFCHWGKKFNYAYLQDPSNKDISQQIEQLDKDGISKIIQHDAQGFSDYLDITDNTICGKHPIGILLESILQTKEKNFKTVLVKYDKSGIIKNPEKDSQVSYASIVVYQQ